MNMNLAHLGAPLLENALNAYLGLDRETAARLATISGKLIAIELAGPDVTLLVRPLDGKVQVSGHRAFEPDTIIRGSPLALTRLGASRKTGAAPLGDDVEIRGDAEVARVFHEVLAGVEIDWEEWLAGRIGDIPAHQAGNAARGLAAGVAGVVEKLRMDISEYLQEEVRLVPARVEVEQFMDEIDHLRGDVDRLEARVERVAAVRGNAAPADDHRGTSD